MSSEIPADLRYAKSHEWVRLTDGIATVGITDHAQQELTDIVFVELPEVGRQLIAGNPCAVVESVKTASDIYAPVSGEVIEINGDLDTEPGRVNTGSYTGGWFFKMRITDPAEAEKLLSSADYGRQIGAC